MVHLLASIFPFLTMKLSTSYAFMNGDSVKNALKNVAIMRETSL